MEIRLAAGCAVVPVTDLGHLTIAADLIILAQEGVMACTDVLQTAVVELDVVVSTYEDATASVVRAILEVLQIDIVTLLCTAADAYPRKFVEVIHLRQEEQTAAHGVGVELLAHVNVAEAGAEDGVTGHVRRVLEVQLGAAVDDDVTALTSVHLQVALVTDMLQAQLVDHGG